MTPHAVGHDKKSALKVDVVVILVAGAQQARIS
jgi:hypothetical protein